MADTWVQASFAFTCSNAEMALLEEAFLAAANLADDDDPDPPSPELLAIFPLSDDDLWSGLRMIFADPDFSCLGAELEGGNTLAEPHRSQVVIHGTTDFQPDAIASLIRRCCRNSLEQAPIGFEYSWSCSRPRVGEFDGGWCVIHAERLDSGTSGEALAAALNA